MRVGALREETRARAQEEEQREQAREARERARERAALASGGASARKLLALEDLVKQLLDLKAARAGAGPAHASDGLPRGAVLSPRALRRMEEALVEKAAQALT